MKKMLHPSVLGQGVSLTASILLVALLSRLLDTSDYATYVMVTALWAMGNALIGTAIGTRIARAAAAGSTSIVVSISEIAFALTVSSVIGAYVLWATSGIGQSVFAGITMLSFVIAEVRISFEIGRKRFHRYLLLVSIRVIVPVVLFYVVGLFFGSTLNLALLSISLGNCVVAFVRPRLWSMPSPERGGGFGQSVGSLNLGLWIIASVDRVLLEQFSEPLALAVYALVYGLLDKGFRALSNVLITRFLGDSLNGGITVIPRKFYVFSAMITVVSVPCGVYGATLVSASRYVPEWRLTAIIAIALLFMLWSAPGYLALLRIGNFRSSILVLFCIVTINIISNLLFLPVFGATAAATNSLASYLLWFVWTRLATRPKRPEAVFGQDSDLSS